MWDSPVTLCTPEIKGKRKKNQKNVKKDEPIKISDVFRGENTPRIMISIA